MGSQSPVQAQTVVGSALPPSLASAASTYQRQRETEGKHLALMARHNLLENWTADVQATVLAAREHVRAARLAREEFRAHVRQFVQVLRTERQTLTSVLRQTRAMVLALQAAGSIHDDGGWLEAEILEWAIEDYEAAAA